MKDYKCSHALKYFYLQVAPGQYVVQLGQYICNARFNSPSKEGSGSIGVSEQLDITTESPSNSVQPVRVQPPTETVVPTSAPIEAVVPKPAPAVPKPAPVVQVVAPVGPATPAASVAASSAASPRFTGTRPPIVRASASVPLRKKYMLKDTPISSFIKPNGEVFVAFNWPDDKTRHVVVGDDHEVEARNVQKMIVDNFNTCKFYFIFLENFA